MARISTYPIISIPTFNDLLIGTDVENLNETKNFSIGDISGLIGQGFVPYVGATENVNLGLFSIEASSFIVDGGLASEFVKADGSLDSTVYVPETRTITINGETYNLSADRSWEINSIDSLTTIGTSGAATYIGKVLNIPVYQPQGNYITQLSGEATGSGPGNASVTLDNTAVISKVLTGLNVTGGNVVDTDTILQAFGKVQNQINGLVGGVQYQGTWNAATNTPFLQSSVGEQGYYYVVSVAGNTNLNGITDWQLGDWAIYDGTAWQKVDNTDAVVSVNGYTGAVVLTASDVGAVPTTRTLTINGVGYDLSLDRAWTVGDVRTDQSYINPSWIVSLDWGKITSTPTTLAGYGITDGALNTTTLTINGITYDLTENRTWSVGTVTSIATTGPLTGGTITGSGTIGITQAGASSDGYLSSTDWNAFNNKQEVISVTAPLTFAAGVVGITQSGAATDGYLSSTDWNTFNSKVGGSGTANTLPMWGSSSSLVNSPLSYAADTFNFQYNSATGGAVVFTNSNGAAYAYTIQMNNFGSPRSTVHGYTDGLVIQFIGGTQVSRMFANGNMILGTGTVDNGYKLEITGDLYVNTIVNAVTDTDKFLVSDGGVIKYRTGAEVLSDIGAQGALTLTTTGTSGPATLIGSVLNIPNYSTDLSGYVPYTGANQTVDLNTQQLQAGHTTLTTNGSTETLTINHTSGSGIAVNITKGGNNEGLKVNKTSGSGNAATIIGTLEATTLVKTGGTSAQFLKADGSVDSTSYGTVSSVAALSLGTSGTDLSSSVVNSTTTPVITLNVPTASAVNRGALSAADWTTFNSKQNAISLTTTGTSGPATLVGSTLNIPNYTTDLSGYVTLDTTQTITGFKTILRGGDVLNFKIGTDALYGLKVAYNQNELAPAGEATWSFVSTFNNGSGTGLETTPISFFRGVLVTGERLLSASVNSNLLDYYGNNPSGRYPIYAYNTGVQQFASSIIVGETDGVVNAVTGAIADLPAGVVANFKGRVIGSNAVSNDEFVTLGQVTSVSRAAISLTTTGTSGPATYDNITGVLNIPEYQGGVTSFNTRTGAVTLTSLDVTTALGFNPVTDLRTLTINGETYDLTANRSWTVGVNPSAREIQTYVATSGQTVFTVTGGYTVGLVDVFINGVRLTSSDYTATNGTTVVLTVGTMVGNIVDIIKYTSGLVNSISGTGTTNYLPKFTGSTTIGNSLVYDNGTNVGIGTTSPLNKLTVSGDGGGSAISYFNNTNLGGYGILINTPDTNNARYALRVNTGAGTVFNVGNGGNVGIGTATPNGKLQVDGDIYVNGADKKIMNYNGAIDYGTLTNNSIRFNTSGNEKVRISGDGNVGIGTPSPSNKLQIASGNIGLDDSWSINFGSGSTFINGTSASNLLLFVTSSTERMRITSGGNVLIGTTTDSGSKLRVEGGELRVTTSNAGVALYYNGGNGEIAAYNWGGNAYIPLVHVGSEHRFNTSATERMRITSAGNVLIGTTSVIGVNTMLSILTGVEREGLVIKLAATNSYSPIWIKNSSDVAMFYVNEGNAGYLNAAAWSYGSDKRLKENIAYIETGINKVMALKPATFDYINGVKNNIGWIAQDVQEVIPEAVGTISKTNDQLTLKSDFIIPYLVKAIQELKQEIDTLKS